MRAVRAAKAVREALSTGQTRAETSVDSREGHPHHQVLFGPNLMEPHVQTLTTSAACRDTDTPGSDTCGQNQSAGVRDRLPRDGGYEAQARALAPVQMKSDGPDRGADIHRAAAEGTRGNGGTLPRLSAIQHSFGRHDVSGVRAHVGGLAASASRRGKA